MMTPQEAAIVAAAVRFERAATAHEATGFAVADLLKAVRARQWRAEGYRILHPNSDRDGDFALAFTKDGFISPNNARLVAAALNVAKVTPEMVE